MVTQSYLCIVSVINARTKMIVHENLQKKNMFDILNRPPVNYQTIRNELLPLLSSNLSLENLDLPCFDSNENVRQCAIATKPGVSVKQQIN
jgi:hypothetical protein